MCCARRESLTGVATVTEGPGWVTRCFSITALSTKGTTYLKRIGSVLDSPEFWSPPVYSGTVCPGKVVKGIKAFSQQMSYPTMARLNDLNGENTKLQENMWCLLFVFMAMTCRMPKQIGRLETCNVGNKRTTSRKSVSCGTWFQSSFFI